MTIVNSWACYIGWIWVAFDPRKQAGTTTGRRLGVIRY